MNYLFSLIVFILYFIAFKYISISIHVNSSTYMLQMSNFFAQPDALAYGKTVEELTAEGVPSHLLAHKEFPGNRPSLSLLFPELNA